MLRYVLAALSNFPSILPQSPRLLSLLTGQIIAISDEQLLTTNVFDASLPETVPPPSLSDTSTFSLDILLNYLSPCNSLALSSARSASVHIKLCKALAFWRSKLSSSSSSVRVVTSSGISSVFRSTASSSPSPASVTCYKLSLALSMFSRIKECHTFGVLVLESPDESVLNEMGDFAKAPSSYSLSSPSFLPRIDWRCAVWAFASDVSNGEIEAAVAALEAANGVDASRVILGIGLFYSKNHRVFRKLVGSKLAELLVAALKKRKSLEVREDSWGRIAVCQALYYHGSALRKLPHSLRAILLSYFIRLFLHLPRLHFVLSFSLSRFTAAHIRGGLRHPHRPSLHERLRRQEPVLFRGHCRRHRRGDGEPRRSRPELAGPVPHGADRPELVQRQDRRAPRFAAFPRV